MKPDYEIGIVGAGFAGITAALRLKKAGKKSFVIFERASEVGGTWRDNIYPGCACDIPSPLYSFSAFPNPDWDNLYSPQPEVLNYIKTVVAKNDLYRHVQLNANIIEARFIKDSVCWQVKDASGNITTVSILLLALGPLNRPKIPTIEGLDNYKGRYFHTSEWDTNYSLKDKKVAVIGTGASAIQVIPNIVSEVQQLTVFQRTPPWVMDRLDQHISESGKKRYRRFPFLQRGKRELFYWINELFGLGFLGNKTINKIMTWIALWKLRKEVKDAKLRKKLTPNYAIGCKRILKSDDYYATFNNTHVSLETVGIKQFTRDGLLTEDGREHEFDVMIFATGFEVADLNIYTKVFGLDGKNLIDHWKLNSAEAYMGTTVSGCPNMAFLLGPNTGLGHNSIIHMLESQMNYIMQYIEYIEKAGDKTYLDLKPHTLHIYNKKIQEKLKNTVWHSGCKSWYINSKGTNTTLYPGLTTTFRKMTKKFEPGVYNEIKVSATNTIADSIIIK